MPRSEIATKAEIPEPPTAADGIIYKKELEHQQESLIQAMRAVEGDLNDGQHAKITRLLIELSAYNVMRLLHELQTEKLQRAFAK